MQMKNLKLSDRHFDYVKGLLEKDAEEIALDISFFEQLNLNAKEFIDERIYLCKEFDLDFWDCVGDNCSDYQQNNYKHYTREKI